MNPWFQTASVVLAACLGMVLGRRSRRLVTPCWLLGYAFSLILIAVLALARHGSTLQFVPPFSWIVTGWARPISLALAIPLGVSTLLNRLPRAGEKVAVCLVTSLLLLWSSVLPCLAPAWVKGRLVNLETTIDANGVCLQSTRYTCGPAAAVTALRKLGLPAGEGEIAILSCASPVTGTLPTSLCKALRNRYGSDGLECRYRLFDSISQLGDSGITLAVVKDAFLLDHCVTVLAIADETVTVADPSVGLRSMSRAQFEAIWRFCGIVLNRSGPEEHPDRDQG